MSTLRVKSELGEIEKVRDFLKKNITGLNLSEKAYYIIELSLLEMCVNIIMYAYPEEKGEIFLKTWKDKDKIFFEIRDTGIHFDPKKIKKPDIKKKIQEQKRGGLGIFLSRKLMDGFQYKREDNQNVLVMYKTINLNYS